MNKNNKSFSTSEPLPLDLGIAYMNAIKLAGFKDERIAEVQKNIFVKELYFSEISPIVSLCLMMFCNDNKIINENNNLYHIEKYIRSFIFNEYGKSEHKDVFDYDIVSSSPSIINNDVFYSYKNLLTEDREELKVKLLQMWPKLNIEEKQKWVHILFISLDYPLIDLLFSNYEDLFIESFLYEMNNEYFDYLMSMFFKTFYFMNEFNYQTPSKTTISIECIYYYNLNEKLNRLIIDNSSDDVADTYKEFVDIVRES